MDFNDFQLLVPTSESPSECKDFRFSRREDLEILLESFKETYPLLKNAIRIGEPVNIADILNKSYLATPKTIPRIPFEFTSKYETQMNKRLPGHRFYSGVPINACISDDYWNCLLPTGIYAHILDNLNIDFQVFTPMFGSHPVIVLKKSATIVSFNYERYPTMNRNANLELFRPGKWWDAYMSKMQETTRYGEFDGVYSLTLPEFTLSSRFNLFVKNKNNIANMRGNLNIINDVIRQDGLDIDTTYLANRLNSVS